MNQAETLKFTKSRMPGPFSPGHSPQPASQAHTPRVLTISSGKGGVGKTSIVTNVAVALASMGKRVMIIDADLGLANVDVMLGLIPRYTIHDVFSGEKSLKDIVLAGPRGVAVLPAASGITELSHLNESEKLFLLSEIEEFGDAFDILLIDNAAGISENVIYFALASQRRIIVVTPEPTSITDAYALMKVLTGRHRVRSYSIIINQAKGPQEAMRVFQQLSTATDRFLHGVSLDYLGHVTQDDAVSRSIRRQTAVLDAYPNSQASRDYSTITENILAKEGEDDADGNIKFFWRHLVRGA
ncbi:MAG: MinD/ParA family protein [Deltaproteobacteria bacterium]